MSSSPSHMFDLRIRFHTIAMLLLALTWGSSTLAAQESKEFQGRLKTLDALLETQRLKLKIPGFAVAIVKDDKVVFAKGYGQRDIAGDKPVDTKTIFAIGSTTKAFTSTLVGMMVDQGEMKWDDPVTKFLPNYKMQTEPADATVLIRDLLCHRTGFRRMGLLWAGGQIPLDEVITRGGSAESTVKFRSKFMYNNVTYMTAGVCAASLTKGDWDAMVTERILKPLGMKDTTTSIAEAKKNKQLSLGYKWDEEKEEFVHQPMRDLYSVRPSGSINSNVDDMVQWLRLQLGKGKFGDKRLISEKSLGETWKKQMAMGGGAHYGLGWMLRKWEKKDVVEHGGNIDGFAAEVAFLPELNTGFVLLMNVGRTPLQQSSIELIFDALYGEKKTKNADAPQVDKSKLVGDYVGNFGPFVDTTFKVTEKDGQLFVDVPGQTNYELKDPDEKGEWFFAITDTIAVTFNRDEKGQVLSLTMAQGGMKPEYLRTDVDHKLDSTAAELEPLLGKYSDEKSGDKVELKAAYGRLVVVAGTEQAFTFKPDADKKDKWVLRPRPELLQLEFKRNDDGSIKSVTRIQRGKKSEMKRLPDAMDGEGKNQSVEDLIARIKKAHGILDKSKFAGFKLGGTANFVNQGALGVATLLFSTSGEHASLMDLGRLAKLREVFDGKLGFSSSTISPDEDLSGVSLSDLRFKYLSWLNPDLISEYDDKSISGVEKVNGEDATVLVLKLKDAPTRTLYISKKTGLIVKEVSSFKAPQIGNLTSTMVLSSFKEVEGVQVASHVEVSNEFTGKLEFEMKNIEAIKEMPKGAFARPAKSLK